MIIFYCRRAQPLEDSCDISSPRSSDSNLPSTHPNPEQPIHHGNGFNYHPQHASSEQSIQISGMNEMDSSSQNWHLQMELLRRKISFEELLGLENERVNSNLMQGNHENSLIFENQTLSENHCHPENQRFVDQSSFQENHFKNQNGKFYFLHLFSLSRNIGLKGIIYVNLIEPLHRHFQLGKDGKILAVYRENLVFGNPLIFFRQPKMSMFKS